MFGKDSESSFSGKNCLVISFDVVGRGDAKRGSEENGTTVTGFSDAVTDAKVGVISVKV